MIVITTPTGQIGRQVLGNLLDSGEQLRVIARDPSKLPAEVCKDLDIVEGSHGDAAVVDKAFAGADAVLWLTMRRTKAGTVGPSRLCRLHRARRRGHSRGTASGAPPPPRRVVRESPRSRPRHSLGRGRETASPPAALAMDDLIAASGVAYRALANPYFMENTLLQADSIKNQGLFFSPIAKAICKLARPSPPATSPPQPRGCCATQAGPVLVRSPLLGPEDLSYNDIAKIISEVLGKEVCFRRIMFEAYKDGFIRLGMSDAMAQGYTDLAWAKDQGLDNGVQRTPQKSTPTSFRQWSEEVLKPAAAS